MKILKGVPKTGITKRIRARADEFTIRDFVAPGTTKQQAHGAVYNLIRRGEVQRVKPGRRGGIPGDVTGAAVFKVIV